MSNMSSKARKAFNRFEAAVREHEAYRDYWPEMEPREYRALMKEYREARRELSRHIAALESRVAKTLV